MMVENESPAVIAGQRGALAFRKTAFQWNTLLLWVCLAGCVGLPTGAWWLRGRGLEAERIREEFWSQAKFRHIEMLLLLYHEEHGAFPPPRYQAEPGGPVHSWRVLLLPHAGSSFKERFAAYDFSQEHNSSNNWQVLKDMQDLDYFSMYGEDSWAHYFAVAKADEWPAKQGLGKLPLRSYLVEKGDDRFLLVEYPHSDLYIWWYDPEY